MPIVLSWDNGADAHCLRAVRPNAAVMRVMAGTVMADRVMAVMRRCADALLVMRPWRSVAAATWHGRLAENAQRVGGKGKIRYISGRSTTLPPS